MFDHLPNVIDEIALEAGTPEAVEKKHAFFTARLDRRWAFNQSSPKKARASVDRQQQILALIKRRISGKTFDEQRFKTKLESKQLITARLMRDGLEQLKDLPMVFAELAEQPPITDANSMAALKAAMLAKLRQHADAYAFRGYQIYAKFMVDHGLIKIHQRLAELGYTPAFITETAHALTSAAEMINVMEAHADLLQTLRDAIVTVLLGPDAAKYKHARRQHQVLCTCWSSTLTIAMPQQLAMAMTICNAIAECYT